MQKSSRSLGELRQPSQRAAGAAKKDSGFSNRPGFLTERDISAVTKEIVWAFFLNDFGVFLIPCVLFIYAFSSLGVCVVVVWYLRKEFFLFRRFADFSLLSFLFPDR
jgi:hypothetical protein